MAWKLSIASTVAVAVVLLFLSPLAAVAQSISGHTGTPAHGSTMTVFGNGFGQRDADPESFFETWDWGTAESSVDTLSSPWSTMGADTDPARFSDEQRRGVAAGNNLRILLPDRITGSSLNDMVYRSDFEVHPGDKVYVSNFFWSTYNGAREFGNGCPQQWKLWNWATHAGQILDQPYTGISWNASGVDGPPDGDPNVWVVHTCAPGTAGETKHSWGVQPPMRTWWQVEIEYQVASGQGAEDGYLRVWFDGELAGETATASWCRDDLNDRIVNDGFVYNTTVLRNYIQWSQCDSRPDTIRHDNTVYQIGTWARVAIGDASTWAACSMREYQPIAAWDNGQISFTVNQGGFDNGDRAWIYVIDDDGDRSGGREITFDGEGGGGDDGIPGQPTPPVLTDATDT